MPGRTPSIIAGLLTFLILAAWGIVSILGQLVLLNGAGENRGFNALSISVICQSVGLIVAVILARWLTDLTITKFNWHRTLAVVTATLAGVLLGAGGSLLSVIVSTLAAGIR